jgi:hypothetical protein
VAKTGNLSEVNNHLARFRDLLASLWVAGLPKLSVPAKAWPKSIYWEAFCQTDALTGGFRGP